MDGGSRNYAVTRDLDVIRIRRLGPDSAGAFLRAVRGGTKAAFTDFGLDFSKVGPAYPNACAPLAALIHFYRARDIRFSVHGAVPPYVAKANLLEPYCPIAHQAQMNVACLDRVWRFGPEEVSPLVTAIVRELARRLTCQSGVLQAFEWALNEVMDNVIQHSRAPHGFAMAQVHAKAKRMAVCVSDCGQGIFNSLRSSSHAPRSPVDAITLALKEGVTRDPAVGQGNGLWGLCQIVRLVSGTLTITSSSASWMMSQDLSVRTHDHLPSLSDENGGTTVDFQLDTDRPIAVSEALSGTASVPHDPTSIYMEQFETDGDFLRYCLREQTGGTGTRQSGERMRNEVINMIQARRRPVVLDFAGLAIVSSSFADEFVGKLVIRLGFVGFNRMVHLRNMNDETKAIVERSVAQRMTEAMRSGGLNNGAPPIR